MTNPLLERWQEIQRASPGRPAVLLPSGETVRTFVEVEEEAQAWERRFAPLAPGAVVAMQLGNSESWPAILLAAWRTGLIPLPLGRHMEAQELQQALTLSGVRWLLRTNSEITILPPSDVQPDADTQFLKLTSGTTSAPRLIRFTAAQLLADSDQICDTKGLTADDVNYGVIPFSHSYGFSNLITPLLSRGVPLVAAEDRMPRAIFEGLQRTQATIFPGTPTFFEAMSSLPASEMPPQLRLCISAGAPLTRLIAGRFQERHGRKIHTFYGSSECGGIAYDASDDLPEVDGYIGAPMRGVDIRPLDSGLIEVCSAAVGLGYFPLDDFAVLGNGCFVPGDLVRLEKGALILTGRTSEIINVAGRKLNPLEVEAELLKCPGVRQAIVFGVASALRGEAAVACIAGEATADEVSRFVQTRLSEWQRPRDFWRVAEIPANERGKISRRELAARYLAR